MRALSIILVIGMFIISCTDDNEMATPRRDYQYFPLTIGNQWIDSITEIQIDAPSALYDTVHRLRKTTVDSIEQAGDTDKIYCTRYSLNENTGLWNPEHRFWYERTATQLIRFEENQIWLDLVFPLYDETTWNPYAYTIYSDTSLRNRVAEVDKTATINDNFYDSTLTIYHRMDSTLIYKYTDISVYARGKGLLERESISIVSDDPDYDYTLPIEERIKTATFVFIQRYYINEKY